MITLDEKTAASPGTESSVGSSPDAGTALDQASLTVGALASSREELVRELGYERIDQATTEVLERLAADPDLSDLAKTHGFAEALDEKAYRLKIAIHAGLPVAAEEVDWRGSRLEAITAPLLETAQALNLERGFDTPEKIGEALRAEQEKIERQTGSIEKAMRADNLSWKSLPPEAAHSLEGFIDGIRASIADPMPSEHLAHLAGYPLLLDALQAAHTERGLPFERPELHVAPGESFLERRFRAAGEMIGKEIAPESVRELGSGSEGTIYYAQAADGTELAIKIKNPDVAMVRDTLTVVASLSLTAARAEPLSPYAESREIAVSPFIAGAPTLQALAEHLNDPNSQTGGPAVAELLESYRAAHPEDTDLAVLAQAVATTVQELSRARVPEPFTAKPINFLATGVSGGKLEITCVDPM